MSINIKRIEWVDFLKGVAIIWLMIYHFYVFDWLRSPVPVFFLLSGLFYSEGASFHHFIKKKTVSILIPFVFFYIIGVVALYFGTVITGTPFVFPEIWKMALMLPVEGGISNPLGVGAIWFLLSLFEIYVIYYLVRLVSSSKLWVWLFGITYFIIASLLLESYAVGSLFFLFYTGSFFIYFAVGHIYRDKILNSETPLWIVLLFVVGYSTTFIDLGGGVLLRIRDVVSSMCLSFLLIFVCKKLMSHNILQSIVVRFVLFEGGNSLTILGTHAVVQTALFMILKEMMPETAFLYIIAFVLELIAVNICVILFNRYVPYLVNKKPLKTIK